jgi:DegV family protein with EDD domain
LTTSSLAAPVIVTDAACDLLPATFQHYAIEVAPLKILFGAEEFENMPHAQFYQRMARGDVHPTTSQPTLVDFRALYRRLGAEGRPILSIHLSEGLSGTVNVARQAARELSNIAVTVHDSGTLSSALGLQVLAAARAARAGCGVPEILSMLEHEYEAGGLYFCVDDLTYLHRGGRIGSVRYQLGQALRIKPVITVSKSGSTKGTYISAGRTRSLSKAIDVFVENIAPVVGKGGKLRAIALYGDDPAVARQLNERLAQEFDCVYLEMMPTAPVLGVHVGPKALGLGFIAGDWPV